MDKTITNARQLAHYVVNCCTRDTSPISNLQLQKILYFLQVVFCRETGMLLFSEEFEAWQYGPVLPDVYHEYSVYGGTPIVETYPASEFFSLQPIESFLRQGINCLRAKSPWELVRSSHAEGMPWSNVWNDGEGSHRVIPNSLILASYASEVAADE